jgi:hypothetical protein
LNTWLLQVAEVAELGIWVAVEEQVAFAQLQVIQFQVAHHIQ